MFRTIWEFEVEPAQAAAFEKMYGPTGDWVQLFQAHEGYEETRLFQDTSVSGRFITVDYWHSEVAYQSFLDAAMEAYSALGKHGLKLVKQMTHLGAGS